MTVVIESITPEGKPHVFTIEVDTLTAGGFFDALADFADENSENIILRIYQDNDNSIRREPDE